MPIYVYETTDGGPYREFELYQSIKEAALTHDPQTGRPVRRVIFGGLEMPRAKSDPPKVPRPHAHPNSCACCNSPPRR